MAATPSGSFSSGTYQYNSSFRSCWTDYCLGNLVFFPFLRIALASYIYSLDGQTTYNYLAFATSAFDKHSLISTIQVAQSVISQSIIASLP